MSPGIHVLYVDDDPDSRDLLATVLERTDDRLDVTTAGSGREGLAVLDGDGIDCIVSDYDMPEMDGLEFFEAVSDRDPDVPFLLLTGASPGEIAGEAIDAGVTDYLQKETVFGAGQYAVLANRIDHAVAKYRAERARSDDDRRLEQYRTLVETAPDPMYLLDETWTITMVNEALVDFLEYDREQLLGSSVDTVFNDDTVERGTEALRDAIEKGDGGTCFESSFETGDGRRKVSETNIAPRYTADGEFVGSVGIVREITRHKERERELSEYETILETAPFCLFVLDADANVVWLNDEYASGFAERKDELRGIEFPKLVERGYYREAAIDRYIEDVRTLLSSGNDQEKATYEIQFRSADGEERIYDVHTKLLPLDDGEFTGTVHALRDITQERHYRREIERQNERLEQFASLVSHDLRNPLNVAQGHLDLLDTRDIEDTHVDKVAQSLSRIEELIDGLLQLARRGQAIGEQEWVSLSSVAREAWATVDTGDARLQLETDVELYGDETRVRALLENLFRNAVEHGSTSPRSRAREDAVEHGSEFERLVVTVGSIEPDGQSDGKGAASDGFYVEDTGPGLPADCESLFDFGYTTAADGTGFGLAIVDQIAEAHGWTVTATDGDDGGARFEIRDVTVSTSGPNAPGSP